MVFFCVFIAVFSLGMWVIQIQNKPGQNVAAAGMSELLCLLCNFLVVCLQMLTIFNSDSSKAWKYLKV